MGRDLKVRGHVLHVEEFGDASSPSVLFLHGGPGMGAYHFERFQADRLGHHLRLITVDQRGVLRSAPIPDGEPLGVMDVIEDCEALRVDLGVDRWSIIGHSFGGYLAVLYARTHPTTVDRLVLDNASLDLGSSARSLLAAAAMEFGAAADASSARACLALAYASGDTSVNYLWDQLTPWLGNLGHRRDNIYIHGENKQLVDDLMVKAPFPIEWWLRGGTHQQRLVAEGRMFVPLWNRLELVTHKTLLVKGLYDVVLAPDQIGAYLHAKPDTELRVFRQSAHFTHMEEPDRYAAVVTEFLCGAS